MKLDPFRHPAKPGANKPLRSFSELASEFGLTMPQLRGYMAGRPDTFPKPKLVSGDKSYYDPAKFLAWFKREVMA